MFNACTGRASVRTHDFGQVARLDPRLQWLKVSVILFQYIGSVVKQTTDVDDTQKLDVIKVQKLKRRSQSSAVEIAIGTWSALSLRRTLTQRCQRKAALHQRGHLLPRAFGRQCSKGKSKSQS